MVYDFRKLRPLPTYPTYPSYHTGLYLEDYFFQYYINNKSKFDAKGTTLIPVSWTTLYVENTPIPIQEYLNALDHTQSYFTVSQHDDGIRQVLPPKTRHFAAGGLGGGIPIPLVCSALPEQLKGGEVDKDILCSFIGSMTHPIRQELWTRYKDQFVFNPPRQWSQSVNNTELQNFIDITKRSNFALAPRGYGLSSFRLYEILQLNTIPVYVSDKFWLPFQDEINWSEFCVLVHSSAITHLPDILRSISPEQQQIMLAKGKEVWHNFFSLEKVSENILKRL